MVWGLACGQHPAPQRQSRGTRGKGGGQECSRVWPAMLSASPSLALPWGGRGNGTPCRPLHPPLPTQQGSCVLVLSLRPGPEPPTAPGLFMKHLLCAATFSSLVSLQPYGYPAWEGGHSRVTPQLWPQDSSNPGPNPGSTTSGSGTPGPTFPVDPRGACATAK